MEKKIRKDKLTILFCGIFLIFISTCSSYTFFYLGDKYHKLGKDYYNSEKKIERERKKLLELEDELDLYNDIDNNIRELKKEFFDRAQKLEEDINSGSSDKKIAYLTFDDGPYYNTYQVLDILDRYNVGATFFTTSINGQFCRDNKDYDCYNLYSEYIKRGHTIANHTYTHAIFKGLYDSPNTFMEAVIKQEEHIKSFTDGYVTNIVRFPGGSSTANHFKVKDGVIELLRQRGYGWVDWSSLDGDGGYLPNRDKAWSTFTGSINENIEVVLFHDYSDITTNMLPDAIEYLENNGYVLLPLFYESSMVNK